MAYSDLGCEGIQRTMSTSSPERPGGVGSLTAYLERVGIGGRGRRSGLSRWLHIHRSEFAALLANKRPSWEEVAMGLGAIGVLDGANRPPNAERVRKA